MNKDSWPKEIGINDIAPIFGNPEFANKGGLEAKDYLPKNLYLIKNNDIDIKLLPDDAVGLLQSVNMEKDIFRKCNHWQS